LKTEEKTERQCGQHREPSGSKIAVCQFVGATSAVALTKVITRSDEHLIGQDMSMRTGANLKKSA